jgi:predicted HTH transcriptional regulator
MMTRQELEDALGIGKTKTITILEKLIADEKIQRIGQSRGTKYKLIDEG